MTTTDQINAARANQFPCVVISKGDFIKMLNPRQLIKSILKNNSCKGRQYGGGNKAVRRANSGELFHYQNNWSSMAQAYIGVTKTKNGFK